MHLKRFQTYMLSFLGMVMFIGCGLITPEPPALSLQRSQAANPSLHPYDARSYSGRLEIFEGTKRVSAIRSAKSNIQRWGFIDSGRLIVVKSSGEEGLAVFELFNVATGVLCDKVLAHNINKERPFWAAQFTD